MPKLGETKRGEEISRTRYHKFIWAACAGCGKQRWARFVVFSQKPARDFCRSCAQRDKKIGAKCREWKGGRILTKQGYVKIWASPDDFFFPMANGDGYIMEHRLIMAKSLGRCLQRWELVHHKNGVKDDNRIENLQLIQEMQHWQITKFEARLARLEKRILVLEAENVALRTQMPITSILGGVE